MNENDDDLCIGTYKRFCETEKIVPVKQYLDKYKQKELSLRFYGLGPKGMRAFISSLTVFLINKKKRNLVFVKMNQYITKLDLASNGLGDQGVIYLAHILRDNVTLDDINLSQNFIGIDGAKELCNLLKENHITINHLKLEGKKWIEDFYNKNFYLCRKFIK